MKMMCVLMMMTAPSEGVHRTRTDEGVYLTRYHVSASRSILLTQIESVFCDVCVPVHETLLYD